jgi:hypothetical protein
LKLLPFDRVTVDGEALQMTADEFLQVPLHERVTWMLERRMSFFLGTRPVDSRVALMALRERWKPLP